MKSYEKNGPGQTTNWTTVLDIDELSIKENQSWIWRGTRVLPRGRDDDDSTAENNVQQQCVSRVLISLSKENEPDIVVLIDASEAL